MKIAQLLNDLKSHDITVKVVNERLKLFYEREEIPSYLIDEVRSHKALLIDFLTQKSKLNTYEIPKIEEHPHGYDLSSPQRRSWIISNLGEKSNISYTMSSAIIIKGSLQEHTLHKAFLKLIQRHEILRTVFKQTENGEIKQYVQSLDEVKFKMNTNQGIRSEEEVDTIIYKELQKPFDLTEGPLLKCNLFKMAPKKWVLSLMIHHIICDSKSMEILFRDVMFFYKDEIEGNLENTLPNLKIQFKDYAAWSNSEYLKNKLETDKKYWLNQFKGELPQLNLSIGKTRSKELKVEIGILQMELESELFNKFKSFCKRKKVTPFSGLVALLKLVFYRYSNQKDITIGFPYYNRAHPELNDTLGFFADTFVLRTKFKGTESFEEFLALINRNLLDAYQHNSYNFEDLVQDLNLKRELNRNILFDVFVIFQNFKKADTTLAVEDLEISQYKKLDARFGAFDLSFNFSEVEQGLLCEIEYKKDIYNANVIKQLITHLELLLQEVLIDPKTGIGEIDMIPNREKENILQFGNAKQTIKLEKRNLDFGLFYFGNQGGEKNNYEIVLKGAEIADQNGFSAVWTPERHFNEFGAPFPSPSVLGAAVAMKTDRIRIRSGSVVPPLHHPVRIAEEWAMVDHLSGGRAEVSFASGWNSNDFIFFPEDYKDRHTVMYEKIETIKKLWNGNKITYPNPENIEIPIEIFPKPLQKNLPIWITATGAIDTFVEAGKIGAGVLTGLLNDDLNELEEKIIAYQSAYAAYGHKGSGRVAVMLHTYIDNSVQKAHDVAKKPLKEYLRKQLEMFQNIPNKHVNDESSNEIEQLLELSVNKYLNNKSLIGTKNSCAEFLKKLLKIGVTEIACLIDFGIETKTVIKGLEKLTALKNHFVLQKEPTNSFQKPERTVINNEGSVRHSKTILEFFQSNVVDSPNTLAMICQKDEYTYMELDHKATQFANYLSSLGIGDGDLVPICTSRSAYMIIAILAVFKTGAAYVPINTKYPKSRVDFILNDTKATVIVTETSLQSNFNEKKAISLIYVDKLNEKINVGSQKQPVSVGENQLAYVIYTSGTTGTPKGVMVTHRSLTSFIIGISKKLQADKKIRILSITDFTFDISIMEYFLPLSFGGTLILADEEEVKDLELLKNLIAIEKPTHLQATPTLWEMLLESGWENKEQTEILSGGETLKTRLKDKLTTIAPNKTIWNLYGPTEATIWASLARINSEDAVTIGTPLSTTRMYVLSDDLQMKPIGIPGELHIGGTQLAEGYLNQFKLTEEKFIKNPFIKGEYLYKTGDLVKWRSDGKLEFLGRRDRQVKVRGHRIEIEEIENHLERLHKIQQALVVYAEIEGLQQLVAYVIAEKFNEEDVILSLKNQLPNYMIPYIYMVLESFPLTLSGKLNIKALPAPGVKIKSTYLAPASKLEKQLTSIWASILNLDEEKIGIKHNFFEIGGNSIKAITLQNKIKAVFDVKIKLEDFFKTPSVREISQIILRLQVKRLEKPKVTI
ncbi:MupA/Atu3671 family FMN-dependent luciferase-like monooxygenase [Ascidiimonas sp. W6]|uniref:MupA/Atu3671 family FMN-dependent luciferase-like monooxygenase n=1 Tax=Ascidiimonas meishanensis TaxID=3128903 RepID=UPI0030ED2805